MSLVFVVVGIWLVYWGIKTKSQMKKDLANAVRTIGKVIDIETSWMQRGRSYSPKVAFKTNQNQVMVFVSPHSSSFNPYKIGQKVEVYYNPQNPNIAGIVGDSNGQLANIFGIIFGVIFTVMGLGFVVVEAFIYMILIGLALNGKF